jgi:hypothetical protein
MEPNLLYFAKYDNQDVVAVLKPVNQSLSKIWIFLPTGAKIMVTEKQIQVTSCTGLKVEQYNVKLPVPT